LRARVAVPGHCCGRQEEQKRAHRHRTASTTSGDARSPYLPLRSPDYREFA
jgi:hypothetical protein